MKYQGPCTARKLIGIVSAYLENKSLLQCVCIYKLLFSSELMTSCVELFNTLDPLFEIVTFVEVVEFLVSYLTQQFWFK
jgi:hypothetical protein